MDALNNMQIREVAPSLSCKWMVGLGRFARMGVLGDGSCFFHSVCSITNLNGYLFASESKQRSIAYEFRCAFAKRFTKEEYVALSRKSVSPKSYNEEHDGFCSPKVWADEVMIRHASKALDINLIFIDLENDTAYCGVHGETADEQLAAGEKIMQKTGIVAWVGHRHFEPIIRVDDAENGIITTLFEPSENKEDESVVQAIMNTYKRSCDL
jgi:hypothetical protein